VRLGVQALDSDRAARGAPGPFARPRVFELHGEASFRAAEEQLVCELLDSALPGFGDRARRRQHPLRASPRRARAARRRAARRRGRACMGTCRACRPRRPPASNGAPLGARDREGVSRAPRPSARELYQAHADAGAPFARARRRGRAVLDGPARALRRGRQPGRACCGRRGASGGVPGADRPGGCWRAAGAADGEELWPLQRSRAVLRDRPSSRRALRRTFWRT